jgi:hypothetical protein
MRFNTRDDSSLYLRVEEPEENIVYCTYQLGRYVSIQKPEARFDSEGMLHILHPVGTTTYRYTQADAQGNILLHEDREMAANGPFLRDNGAGAVALVGGIAHGAGAARQREKLSTGQSGPTAQAAPLGGAK